MEFKNIFPPSSLQLIALTLNRGGDDQPILTIPIFLF